MRGSARGRDGGGDRGGRKEVLRPWLAGTGFRIVTGVFVHQDVEVAVAFPDASVRLTHLFQDHALDRLSHSAYLQGRELLLRVGPYGAVPGLSKQVRARLLPPVERDGALSMPLRWEAGGATGALFPVLDADLILKPAGPTGSQLTLLGSYRAPLGRLGHMLDAALLGRVATATITALLDDLGTALRDPVPQIAQPHPGPAPHLHSVVDPDTA